MVADRTWFLRCDAEECPEEFWPTFPSFVTGDVRRQALTIGWLCVAMNVAIDIQAQNGTIAYHQPRVRNFDYCPSCRYAYENLPGIIDWDET